MTSDIEQAKLLPCPFCGVVAEILFDPGLPLERRIYSIGCADMGCIAFAMADNICNVGLKCGIDKWNTRHDPYKRTEVEAFETEQFNSDYIYSCLHGFRGSYKKYLETVVTNLREQLGNSCILEDRDGLLTEGHKAALSMIAGGSVD